MLIPPVRVEVADIVPTQAVRDEWVHEKHRYWWRSYAGDVYPHAELHDGRVVLRDGHHRVARAKALGQRWIWIRLYEPPTPPT
jgi:hypothetical protein